MAGFPVRLPNPCDYLLPENLGVRKAFQDMESALRENRMTLEAIKVYAS